MSNRLQNTRLLAAAMGAILDVPGGPPDDRLRWEVVATRDVGSHRRLAVRLPVSERLKAAVLAASEFVRRGKKHWRDGTDNPRKPCFKCGDRTASDGFWRVLCDDCYQSAPDTYCTQCGERLPPGHGKRCDNCLPEIPF